MKGSFKSIKSVDARMQAAGEIFASDLALNHGPSKCLSISSITSISSRSFVCDLGLSKKFECILEASAGSAAPLFPLPAAQARSWTFFFSSKMHVTDAGL